MNKKQIEMILAIERFSNITKAADFIGITQATLSKFLNNTEEKFNTKIFYRYSRSVTPSLEGEILLRSFKVILKEYEKIDLELSSLRNGGLKNIRIGTHQILGKHFIPKIEEFSQKEKDLLINYTFNNSRKITEQVANGEIDIGVVADPQKYPNLVIKPLWKEFIGLYSKDGKLKESILYNSNMLFANKLLNELAFSNKRKVDDYDLIYSILCKTDNMGLLPNPIAESESKLKLIKKLNPTLDICLVYNVNKVSSQLLRKIITIIKKV